MIICKLPPKQGIRFAWLPVWTEDGKVWLEWVHFRYNDVGLEGSYTYRRWVPTKEYDAGKRAWTAEVVDDAEFLKYLDSMVFCCVSCNWWHRQRENATPDGAEWECQECHDER